MKKTKETTNYADLNTIIVSGTVTFNNRIAEGVANVGIKCNYHLETVDKDFTTYPVVKLFNNEKYEVEDIEKGDLITLKAHYSTRKYKEKYFTEVIADSFEIVE